jgi:hypothetical protein
MKKIISIISCFSFVFCFIAVYSSQEKQSYSLEYRCPQNHNYRHTDDEQAYLSFNKKYNRKDIVFNNAKKEDTKFIEVFGFKNTYDLCKNKGYETLSVDFEFIMNKKDTCPSNAVYDQIGTFITIRTDIPNYNEIIKIINKYNGDMRYPHDTKDLVKYLPSIKEMFEPRYLKYPKCAFYLNFMIQNI